MTLEQEVFNRELRGMIHELFQRVWDLERENKALRNKIINLGEKLKWLDMLRNINFQLEDFKTLHGPDNRITLILVLKNLVLDEDSKGCRGNMPCEVD